MRNLGVFLLLLGIAGFLVSSSRLSNLEPVPEGTSVRRSLDYPAGRWEVGRYASAAVAGFGILMALFPKGR